jgi:hypothetical protein
VFRCSILLPACLPTCLPARPPASPFIHRALRQAHCRHQRRVRVPKVIQDLSSFPFCLSPFATLFFFFLVWSLCIVVCTAAHRLGRVIGNNIASLLQHVSRKSWAVRGVSAALCFALHRIASLPQPSLTVAVLPLLPLQHGHAMPSSASPGPSMGTFIIRRRAPPIETPPTPPRRQPHAWAFLPSCTSKQPGVNQPEYFTTRRSPDHYYRAVAVAVAVSVTVAVTVAAKPAAAAPVAAAVVATTTTPGPGATRYVLGTHTRSRLCDHQSGRPQFW